MHVLFAAFLLLTALHFPTNAFEESNKFCIRTEPMLLTELEKHVNPVEGDPRCDVLATTMTLKEKESFLKTMCEGHGGSTRDEYHYFKLRNGDLKGHASYQEICDGKVNPLLGWVPYEMIQQNFVAELNPKERFNYIAKATDLEREKTELCHFRHADLVMNTTSDLFTCIAMVFEDNFYGLDANINVLVEIQPLMYEIRNVSYLPWTNSTASYKTHLGETVLKNTKSQPKQIYGGINYAYVEKVKLNTSSIYGQNLEKLPLLFEHRGAVLELDNDGVGGIDVKEKAYFGRVMDPKSSVKVEIIGQWAEHDRQFGADIYEYFGYGIKRFRHELPKGDVSFVLIENTEPVFDMLESTHIASATLHTPDNGEKQNRHESERLTDGLESTNRSHSLGVNITEESTDLENDQPSSSGHPYPGFYPWFVFSCILVGCVILAALIGVIRSVSKGREKKHEYKLADA